MRGRPKPKPAAPGDDVSAAHCRAPYSPSSPWNTPIGRSPAYGARDAIRKAAIGTLSSDPTQYTLPVYEVDSRARRVKVRLTGWYSDVSDEGRRLRTSRGVTVDIPLPEGAAPAAGSDAQIVVVDHRTGDEWGMWRAERAADGMWRAENAYHYSVKWDGVPPRSRDGRPFLSRGAGVPYLAGLVRPCELRQGRIEHALAFAYDHASPRYVHPATKSDGNGSVATDLPEGSRLQLDPTLRQRDIEAWGCRGPCLVIARALQRYGMYVIDNAGRPKVMLEYEGTARWGGIVTSETSPRSRTPPSGSSRAARAWARRATTVCAALHAATSSAVATATTASSAGAATTSSMGVVATTSSTRAQAPTASTASWGTTACSAAPGPTS